MKATFTLRRENWIEKYGITEFNVTEFLPDNGTFSVDVGCRHGINRLCKNGLFTFFGLSCDSHASEFVVSVSNINPKRKGWKKLILEEKFDGASRRLSGIDVMLHKSGIVRHSYAPIWVKCLEIK